MVTRVSDNRTENRYELSVDDEPAGLIDYFAVEGGRDLFHTEVFPGFSGRGLAAEMVAGALSDLRSQRLYLVPTCPYIQGYLRKHPEDMDLLSESVREQMHLG